MSSGEVTLSPEDISGANTSEPYEGQILLLHADDYSEEEVTHTSINGPSSWIKDFVPLEHLNTLAFCLQTKTRLQLARDCNSIEPGGNF